MSAKLIDGKELSNKTMVELKQRIEKLNEKNIIPGLSVILVGDDSASKIYVRNKQRTSESLNIKSITIRLESTISQEMLIKEIEALNLDNSVHGILVQLPLPPHINAQETLSCIKPEKDVDGFHMVNVGKLCLGLDGIVACTPKGVFKMLETTGVELFGKEVVIVGKSNIVGKPLAVMMLNNKATVTVCHKATKDLAYHTRKAEILIVAAGSPKLITKNMVKPGAIVIDVGINRVDGKIVGDVDFDEVKDIAGYLTPVPGGVGKMTIAMLMENVVSIAEKEYFSVHAT